ncbi:MAG: hypothetical protein DCC58_08355 [Chloroflexi bacterium]|nr:MAG: hypothetical protein DCC58_08355 [Chloroflexota bacterium]
MFHAAWLRRALVLLLGFGSIVAALPQARPIPAHAAGADYFPETGHTLSGPIREAWVAGGGVWLFGYPISEPMRWSTRSGSTVIAQYFERARLEYHPEYEGTVYRVLGGLLGSDLTANRSDEPAFRPAEPSSAGGCVFHEATGHNLCAEFLTWWEREGGLPTFGYPISEPFEEGGFVVQYFERARFEHHPEYAGTRWEVALGHLGTIDATRRGLLETPAFARVEPQMAVTRVEVALRSEPAGGETLAVLSAGTPVALIGGPSWDAYRVYVDGRVGWVRFGDLTWSVTDDPRSATRTSLQMFDQALDARSAEISPLVSIGVYDPLTNQLFEGGSAGPIAAASLAKALLLTVLLKQAEQRGEIGVTDWDGTLIQMIEFSDNDAANVIWAAVGGEPEVRAFLDEQRLTGFAIPDPYDWGAISATAGDWAQFFGLLGSGQILSPANTAYVLDLMRDVLSEHRFGVITPGENLVAIGKNGWYWDDEPEFVVRVTSAGLVDSTEGPPGIAPLAVVMLSHVPGEYGTEWGASIGFEVQQAAVRYATVRWAEYYHRAGPSPAVRLAAQGGAVTSLSDFATVVSHAVTPWGR